MSTRAAGGENVAELAHRRIERSIYDLSDEPRCVEPGEWSEPPAGWHCATCGRSWSQTGARAELRRLSAAADVRRRFAPHQRRHAHAVEMAREGVPLPVIQRQLGHAYLGIEINTIHARRPPMIPASAGLHL